MQNFYLYLVIAFLLVFIFGLTYGARINRVRIGSDSSEPRDANPLNWILPIGLLVVAIHFLSPAEFRLTSLLDLQDQAKATSTLVDDGTLATQDKLDDSPDVENDLAQPPPPIFTDPDTTPFEFEDDKVPPPPQEEAFFQVAAYKSEVNSKRKLDDIKDNPRAKVVYTTDGLYRVGYGDFNSEQEAKAFGVRRGIKGFAITFSL
jgi:hypothetical protein